MFCENCGNKIDNSHKFCTKCGNSTTVEVKNDSAMQQKPVLLNDKWWQRFLKVIYIFLCLQIFWIVPVVWISNDSRYTGYYLGQSQYEDTYGLAFWYSLLAIAIFLVITRLIKITVLYVAMGRKPEWKREFKKLY